MKSTTWRAEPANATWSPRDSHNHPGRFGGGTPRRGGTPSSALLAGLRVHGDLDRGPRVVGESHNQAVGADRGDRVDSGLVKQARRGGAGRERVADECLDLGRGHFCASATSCSTNSAALVASSVRGASTGSSQRRACHVVGPTARFTYQTW